MKVNGKTETLFAPQSLKAYLLAGGYDIDKIAVERNGEIVPRAAYAHCQLHDEDKLEIVRFVGGG